MLKAKERPPVKAVCKLSESVVESFFVEFVLEATGDVHSFST